MMNVDDSESTFDLSIITITHKVNNELIRCIKSCTFTKISVDHILVFPKKEKGKIPNDLINNFSVIFDSGKGVYNALNKGISIARGKKILALHGDNFFTKNGPNIIEKYINYQNIQFGCLSSFENKNTKSFLFSKINFFNLILGLYPPHPGLLLESDEFAKLGLYNEKYRICADFEYYLKIYKLRININYINEKIIISPSGGISSSGIKSIISIIDERLRILIKFYWYLSPLFPISILFGYGVKILHKIFYIN